MSLTVLQCQTRVARVIGLSLSVSDDMALMLGWYNDAVEQFLRETKLNVRPAAVSVTAGQSDYTLDDDILSMQAMWYGPNTGTDAMMQPITPEDMYVRRMVERSGGGPPNFYSLLGAHTLMIDPAPSDSGDVINMLYVPRPAAMSTSADIPSATANGNIPAEYHVILEAYVKWKAGEAEEHRPSDNGLQFQAEWERAVTRVKAELKRKAGPVIGSVRMGRGGVAHGYGNGVDIR
jgi:hypothetical protein